MSTSSGGEVVIPRGCEEVGVLLRQRIGDLEWAVVHEEVLRAASGLRVACVFGRTDPLGVKTLGSTLVRGSASMAFLLRIEELGAAQSRVSVWMAGGAPASGIDFGRHKAAIRHLLEPLEALDLPEGGRGGRHPLP